MPVPAAVALAPAALGFLSNAGQAISGALNLKDDKAELSRLTPAFYKVQKEYDENRNQALGLAQSGITQTAKDYYTDTAGAGLGTGIDALRQLGGNPNDVARLMSSYNDSIRKVMAEDSEKQIGNIKYFQQVNKDLAGQKTMQWSINEYQPYQNKLKELTQRIAADKQNIWGGVQGAIGSAQAGVTALQNNDLLGKLYGGDTAGATKTSSVLGGGSISNPGRFQNTFGVPDIFDVTVGENYNRPDASQTQRTANPGMTEEQLNSLEQLLNEVRQNLQPQ